jgi:hypothetical protein
MQYSRVFRKVKYLVKLSICSTGRTVLYCTLLNIYFILKSGNVALFFGNTALVFNIPIFSTAHTILMELRVFITFIIRLQCSSVKVE